MEQKVESLSMWCKKFFGKKPCQSSRAFKAELQAMQSHDWKDLATMFKATDTTTQMPVAQEDNLFM